MIKFLNRFNDRFVSKWLVLAMDIFIVGFSFIIATAIRFNFNLTYLDPSLFKYHLLWVVLIRTATFIFFRTYTGIIRHSSIEDAKLLFKAAFFSTLEILLFAIIPSFGLADYLKIPYSIIAIDFFIVLFGLVSSRILIKTIFEGLLDTFKSKKKVIIYGSGRLGIITKNTLIGDKKNNYQILCFIDDNPQKIGKSIEGIKVLSKKEAKQEILENRGEEIEIIFAIQSISPARKTDLVDEFLDLDLKIRVVPPVKQWINGTLSTNQIHQISIEDLLERPSIQINNRLVKSAIEGKRVMITGAAGSIGSEIVRQILYFNPTELVLVDQAESPLYDLETELTRVKSKSHYTTKIFLEIKNITNAIQITKVFENYQPQIVFHAAAYKHVPLMESNPFKAVEVNTFGTQLLANLASKYKVEKFVFISTDKAVNPTNVMGASKRLAEIYVQSLNKHHANETRFIVTRFGNVLGSNGSVIPLFKKQIEKGGPVTVTHPDIIRYFMTIPEACQLVLEAGTMGKGGEIYVFDMGVPVRIIDLAEKMIKLSGFEPYTQIPISFSGLRAGEKLYEELLSNEETTIATHHPKIMVAKVKAGDFEDLKNSLDTTKTRLNAMDANEIVGFLKKMVPDYISNNSPFEQLDGVKI
ncbi:polysaccharide biosynthesis protein [Lacihabitans sp. LS3-19]|uniref:polysaccharide biosynthesis protein n=1 Tax=Lacihabitans sp. LS3-19 TaxID=2487335 RepID=UPI0020CE6B7C|nr:nucleoside-diphosphate sugar epimerase/dehydratase [Lacihabitans sp. LS3-19]MCP9769398.1 polysaccharide biosynthesis protein [Lacihabitans sp. LS3-19]